MSDTVNFDSKSNKEFLADQKTEMEKHKWIESEKAGYDLGEGCLMAWIKSHAKNFREWWFSREYA